MNRYPEGVENRDGSFLRKRGLNMSIVSESHGRNHVRSRAGKHGFGILLLVLTFAVGVAAGPVQATEEYSPSDAGQPLRVAAYVVNPVGVVFDYLILRPAYWIGSREPFKTLFGRRD